MTGLKKYKPSRPCNLIKLASRNVALGARIWTILKSNIFKSLKVLQIVEQEKKGSSLILSAIYVRSDEQ